MKLNDSGLLLPKYVALSSNDVYHRVISGKFDYSYNPIVRAACGLSNERVYLVWAISESVKKWYRLCRRCWNETE